MSKLVGSVNIGTGPDYTDFCQDMIIPTRRVVKSNLPVDATSIPYAEGVEDMVNLVNLTRGLVSRGYRDEEIRGILGENFLRVFRSIYKVS
jgi:membrane dipeptidase